MKRNTSGATLLLGLLLLLATPLPLRAGHFIGQVRDASDSRPLAGAEIRDTTGVLLTMTTARGDFALDHEGDSLRVLVLMDGYHQQVALLLADRHTTIELASLGGTLEGVTVERDRVRRVGSSFDFTPEEISMLPTILGEKDLMRFIQVLPGVAQGMEGGMGYYVRGAGNGNNRVEMNGVPIASPTHLFGLLSVVPPGLVDRSTFQSGGISVASGDFLSALLRLESHRPSKTGMHGSVTLSPIILGASLQGAPKKSRVTFRLAGRTSLLHPEYLLVQKIVGREQLPDDVNPQMQDLGLQLFWTPDKRHTIDLMLFGSRDDLRYKMIMDQELDDENYLITLGWSNFAARLGWVYALSERRRLETMVYYTRSANHNTIENVKSASKMWSHGTELAFRSRFDTYWREINLTTGVDLKRQTFLPMAKVEAEGQTSTTQREKESPTHTLSIYGEGLLKRPRYNVALGLRYNLFRDENGQSIHDLEWRLRGRLTLSQAMGIEASVDRQTQLHHILEGLPVGWALDLSVPASRRFGPEHSTLFYLGGYLSGGSSRHLSIGGYYRDLSGLISYTTDKGVPSENPAWEEEVTTGRGRSYGLEVWAEQSQGRWTGSIAYTLSRTTRQYPEINGGEEFPFAFDRTHILNLQSHFDVIRRPRRIQRLDLAAYITSGNRLTVAKAIYSSPDLPYWFTQRDIPSWQSDYHALARTEMTEMNAFRTPTYIRMDLGYTFLWHGPKVDNELTLSVFNVLARKNPYMIFLDNKGWKQMSIPAHPGPVTSLGAPLLILSRSLDRGGSLNSARKRGHFFACLL
jgi:hypothetical protein